MLPEEEQERVSSPLHTISGSDVQVAVLLLSCCSYCDAPVVSFSFFISGRRINKTFLYLFTFFAHVM